MFPHSASHDVTIASVRNVLAVAAVLVVALRACELATAARRRSDDALHLARDQEVLYTWSLAEDRRARDSRHAAESGGAAAGNVLGQK